MSARPADASPLPSAHPGPPLAVCLVSDHLREARPIACAIPGSQLVMLPGCGHIPSIEAPEQYRHAVVEFLSH